MAAALAARLHVGPAPYMQPMPCQSKVRNALILPDDKIAYPFTAASFFGWLGVKWLLPCSIVCRSWQIAALRPESWSHSTLCAQRRSSDIYPLRDSNVHLLSDGFVLRVAKRLRDVAQRAQLEVLPSRRSASGSGMCCTTSPDVGICESESSQLEVCKYRFGERDFWFIQYNTESYGWFCHVSEVAIGLKTWAPCLVMCEHLSRADAPTLTSSRCLDLGAGNGVLGTVIAALGGYVTITDIDDVSLRVSDLNVQLNSVVDSCIVHKLPYGKAEASRYKEEHDAAFDFIFGADILYSDNVAATVFETVQLLLAPGGKFLLGFVERHAGLTTELQSAAADAGFSWDGPSEIGKAQLRTQPTAADDVRSGMQGALFEFSKQLREARGEAAAAARSTTKRGNGERKDKVLLYTFARLEQFCLDAMD